jgi:type IV secretory pathway TraG/TraD family ATPase VirD4
MNEDTSWVPDSSGTTARGSWLFITARPDQRKTLIPLISAWVDIAMNALMVLPEDLNRRLWFIMDELASLQKLTCLQGGLAEVRKYGGCLLVGFQSKPQLEEIYGRNSTEAMLDLFNTNVFFRCKEPSTQQWVSKILGDKEETEPTENISFGANSLRDGVSLSRHTRQKPLVMPSELSLLNKLECFIKFPGDYPCTKLQTKLQRIYLQKKQAFILKPERKREYPDNGIASSEIKKEILI